MPTSRPPQRGLRGHAAILSVLALCAGCGPDGRPAGYAPDGTQQILGVADPEAAAAEPALEAAVAGQDEEAAGISPVPAFRGGDGHWRIEIQSVGDLRHDVVLSQGDARMTGTLGYRPVPGVGEEGPFDLHGALHGPQGDAPMRVHLQREACIDEAGAHAWKVQVDVEGQAPRDGCGDIAM